MANQTSEADDMTPLGMDPYIEDITDPSEQEIENSEGDDEEETTTYSITSYGADYPVDSLVSRLNADDIVIPPFQRSYVWDIKRASRFVESLLLGLPVPGIFLSRTEANGELLVIDGQQRLRTLQFFYTGVFGPTGLPFTLVDVTKTLLGIDYNSLDVGPRRRLDNSILHATIVQQDRPQDGGSSISRIFARLNTGGLQLTAQEIRASLSYGPFNDLLHELNGAPSWRKVFGPISKRLRDEELILRFFAFLYEGASYAKGLREFLDKYMEKNRKLEWQTSAQLRQAFTPTIELIYEGLGADAFRPNRTINAAVFDAVMVGVARALAADKDLPAAKVSQVYHNLLNDPGFRKATDKGTNAEQSVQDRLDIATRTFGEA
jgi:hypothetical protein